MKYLLFVLSLFLLASAQAQPLQITKSWNRRNINYIGNGWVGGYVDALGYNSSAVGYGIPGNHATAISAFQSWDYYSALPVWRTPYLGNSRSHQVKLVTNLLVDFRFDTSEIKDYSQVLDLQRNCVTTRFSYQNLDFEIQSLVPRRTRHVVMFITRVVNHRRTVAWIDIQRTLNDSLTRHARIQGCAQPRLEADSLIHLRYPGTFGTLQAACNPGKRVKLGQYETFADTGYFEIRGTKSGDPGAELRAVQRHNARHFEPVHVRKYNKFLEALAPGTRADWLVQQQVDFLKQTELGLEFPDDDSLQHLYKLCQYVNYNNLGAPQLPMASLLGTGGWSGTSYAWDSYFPIVACLHEGQTAGLDALFDNYARQWPKVMPFINFSADESPWQGSGRYKNEFHETAAGPAFLSLWQDFLTLKEDKAGLARNRKRILAFAQARTVGLETYGPDAPADARGKLYKRGKYVAGAPGDARKQVTYELRSLESDRRERWFTDLAMSYQWLFAKAANHAGEKEAQRLRTLAGQLYIPQTPTLYTMWALDSFPNVRRDGWFGCAFNFPTAAPGVYPFGTRWNDAKMRYTLDTMYSPAMTSDKRFVGWGGYPLVGLLAAQRLGMKDLCQRLFTDPKLLGLSGKVNLRTGNSVEDTDSFLQVFGALHVLAQESVVWFANDTSHLFPAGAWLGKSVKINALTLAKNGLLRGQRRGNSYEVTMYLPAGRHVFVTRQRPTFTEDNKPQEQRLPTGEYAYTVEARKPIALELSGEVE